VDVNTEKIGKRANNIADEMGEQDKPAPAGESV